MLVLACSPSHALPPPWQIEREKGAADLIVIAKTTKSTPSSDVPKFDSKIGLRPVDVLKGPADAKQAVKGKDVTLFIVYSKPAPPKTVGAPAPQMIGGLGQPKVRDADVALVFLKKTDRKGHYQVVCGSLGYVSLLVRKEGDAPSLKNTLGGLRQACAHMEDPKARSRMEQYYQKALEHVDKQLRQLKDGQRGR